MMLRSDKHPCLPALARQQAGMSILVIDDDPEIRSSVGMFLQARGHMVYEAADGFVGVKVLRKEAVDIVITDVKMPGMDGFEVLREVKRLSPDTEVIVITAFSEVEHAFRAMRDGAFDFFTKPFKVEELNASLQRTMRYQALHREKNRIQVRLDRINTESRQRFGLAAIVGESGAICAVREQIRQVCQSVDTTVLVCGETGTGKELVARAIHTEGARAGGPFVPVNCSAIPEALFESEFYGHERGAFTDARRARKGHFEQADGGTLFLDEIGDMDLGMQRKLLRTLEEKCIRRVGGSREVAVDVRVVSATNRNLSGMVREGVFREDLFYRLNVFTIRVPLLRERLEDILPLAQYFLSRYAEEMRKSIQGFAPEAVALLKAYPFPGNVRELNNTIERAAILCGNGQVRADHLQDLTAGAGGLPESRRQTAPAPCEAEGLPAPDVAGVESLNLAALERQAVGEAIRRCDGNQTRAAGLLGISRNTLRRRIRAYDLVEGSAS